MHFQESPEQIQIRDLARKLVREKLKPVIDADEESKKFRPEMISEMGKLGLTGITIPEENEGLGQGYLEFVRFVEEVARVSAGYAISVSVTGLTQLVLNEFGNDAQKKKYLNRLAQGVAIGGFSLSEASSGSDAGSLRTRAEKRGDHYVVNGTKLWCTQGDVSEVIILMARTGAEGPRGISAFLLEKGTPGFSMGKCEAKMGLNVSHTMELVLENVKIPAANLLGKEGDGFTIAMTALDAGRINMGATALGLASEALEIASTHANERKQFGKAIGEFQGISFMLADMKTQLDAARLLVYRAAWMKDQKLPFSQEAAMAKLFATDMAMKVTTDAVQILGGSGYTKDFPCERLMREAKVLQIVEGTNQVQRLVIGRSVLKNPQGVA